MSAVTLHWQFENTYAQLPALFFSKCAPTAVRAPTLVKFNHGLATTLGLLDESTQAGAAQRIPLAHEFAGNALPAGAEPLAQAYAGHQFGGFSVWAMAGQYCLANTSHQAVNGLIYSSKALARRLIRAEVMDAQHLVPCCANI